MTMDSAFHRASVVMVSSTVSTSPTKTAAVRLLPSIADF